MRNRFGRRKSMALAGVLAIGLGLVTACSGGNGDSAAEPAESQTQPSDYSKSVHLLSAVTDQTAALYLDLDAAFAADWLDRTGQTVTIEQSAGSSGAQRDAIIGGSLKADFTALGIGIDIDAIQAQGLTDEGWQQRYDYISSPFSTAVAFVVRTGNPAGVAEWEDLVESDTGVVVTDPSADSDARWYYAAPWAYSLDKQPEDFEAASAFVQQFHERVAVSAKSEAEAERAFVEGGEGDVWVTTESNALRVANGPGQGKVEVVVPSVTLTVEPIIAVVDANADADGTREVANGYADYLFTEAAQVVAAEHYFRPRFASVAEQHADVFTTVTLLTVDDNLTGWEDLQQALFADGGLYGTLPGKS